MIMKLRLFALVPVFLLACADEGIDVEDAGPGDPDCVAEECDDDPLPDDGLDCPAGCPSDRVCNSGRCVLPIDSVCTAVEQCADSATCVVKPAVDEAVCRPTCGESVGCAATDHCIPLSNGEAACLPLPSNNLWTVRAVSAVIDGGINFDPGGNDPDPYVSLFLGTLSTSIGSTPVIDDSLTPVWNHDFPGRIRHSDLRLADFWTRDSDDGTDNNISFLTDQTVEPFWGGELHRFTYSHQGALELIVEVVP